MSIPVDFRFSQTNLQDYLDCPRRFELRYIQKLKWPAEPTQPFEEQHTFLERGINFHRAAHQYFIGLPEEIISNTLIDPVLQVWWNHLITWVKDENFSEKPFTETALQGNIEGKKYIASYDLVVKQNNGRVLIVDWKTTPSRPVSRFRNARMQTKLYPALMVHAGQHLFNNPDAVQPANLDMMYWFANHPGDPELITYSQARYEDDLSAIREITQQIEQTQPGGFQKTNNKKRCDYCIYRSLCDRGTQAGAWSVESEDNLEMDLDDLLQKFTNELDQIGEAWL